jgi:hypothetical protein
MAVMGAFERIGCSVERAPNRGKMQTREALMEPSVTNGARANNRERDRLLYRWKTDRSPNERLSSRESAGDSGRYNDRRC